MFDYFVGELKCLVCSSVSSANSSTGMQTKIREEPNLDFLGVGNCLEVSQKRAEGVDYLTVNVLEANKAIRIIEMWTCPLCKSTNWAQIAVEDGIITRVSTVEKGTHVLKEANFISEELLFEEAKSQGIQEDRYGGIHDVQLSLSVLLKILLEKL